MQKNPNQLFAQLTSTTINNLSSLYELWSWTGFSNNIKTVGYSNRTVCTTVCSLPWYDDDPSFTSMVAHSSVLSWNQTRPEGLRGTDYIMPRRIQKEGLARDALWCSSGLQTMHPDYSLKGWLGEQVEAEDGASACDLQTSHKHTST